MYRMARVPDLRKTPGVLTPTSLSVPLRLLQYNRRFVNVVVGLGKKRSPNSNTA